MNNNEFYPKFCECLECADGTCRTYSYNLKWLSGQVEDITDLPSVLDVLKAAKLSRRGNVLTALKSYCKNVLKNNELSNNLLLPLKDAKREADKKRSSH